MSYPAKNLVSDPQVLLRLLTSATPRAANEASAASPSHGTNSPSLFTGTAMPPTGNPKVAVQVLFSSLYQGMFKRGI